MPEKYPTDRASLERDCTEEFYRAGGKGGQNRNKVETAVRLVHRHTGVTVTATERRSQGHNREIAYARMAERLEEMQREETPRIETQPTHASQERRLEEKRRVGVVKRMRSAPPPEE